jgi:peptidoglycan/xylan/chitin deacetylase (PgdA/CDA1 family)
MYHKLGPRPPRVRLKGLYLSKSLFQSQLLELHEDGFRSCRLDETVAHTANTNRLVALTFDDGFANVITYGLDVLERQNFRAIQFLVANSIGGANTWEQALGEAPERLMDESQIRTWLASGHEIGSHTLDHPMLTKLPTDQAREEISASKKKLEDLFGVPVRDFCYPNGDWDQRIRDMVVEAGYRNAFTTECGLNNSATDTFALKRLTVRYRSRSFRSLFEWVADTLSARRCLTTDRSR